MVNPAVVLIKVVKVNSYSGLSQYFLISFMSW